MSIEVDRASLGTSPCGVCGAQVAELRRGRCWGCYTRWSELRPVGRGAACVICNERRREQLRLCELHKRSLPMCHGCAARTLKLVPLPPTIEGIRELLTVRDRREDERRQDALDRRIFPRERRVGERRRPPRVGQPTPADSASLSAQLGDMVIEIDADDCEIVEETMVQRRPQAPSAEAGSLSAALAASGSTPEG